MPPIRGNNRASDSTAKCCHGGFWEAVGEAWEAFGQVQESVWKDADMGPDSEAIGVPIRDSRGSVSLSPLAFGPPGQVSG